jgi:putative oxidoreductase
MDSSKQNWFLSIFLLAIRLYWGISLLIAGIGKFGHLDQVITSFTQLGLIWPSFFAPLIALVETLGGLALVLGLAARIMMVPLSIMMIVAYPTAHPAALAAFFSDPPAFMTEIPTTFLLVSLFVLLVGPGIFSIDYLICSRRRKSR